MSCALGAVGMDGADACKLRGSSGGGAIVRTALMPENTSSGSLKLNRRIPECMLHGR